MAGSLWPCSGAVPKGVAQGGQWGEGPPPLLARVAPCGVWPVAKVSPPQWGAYRAVGGQSGVWPKVASGVLALWPESGSPLPVWCSQWPVSGQ